MVQSGKVNRSLKKMLYCQEFGKIERKFNHGKRYWDKVKKSNKIGQE